MARESEEQIVLRPIGVIRSPHLRAEDTPIQPTYAQGIRGEAHILAEFADGLNDLDGFSHIVLLVHLHQAAPPKMTVTPFLDDEPRGVFATCAPCRPNAIGLSVVRLLGRTGAVLHLEDVDLLDGTPLLDIKPYVPRFHDHGEVRTGWHASVDEETARERGRRNYRGGD